MQSNTNHYRHQCDLCSSNDLNVVYEVPDSLIGSKIAVCSKCGLVQSLSKFSAKRKTKKVSTSSGADWGNIRHGKRIRTNTLQAILDDLIPWHQIKRILDVGSNRGDFLRWVTSTKSLIEAIGVEPDSSIIGPIEHSDITTIYNKRFEDTSLPNNYFDLVYCLHTLEHADSASAMLQQMHSITRPGGFLFLEVPNLKVVSLPDILEEFFIDKHRFHFDRETLLEFLFKKGFEVKWISSQDDIFNITVLAIKAADIRINRDSHDESRYNQNVEIVQQYMHTLDSNRRRVRDFVEKKLTPFLGRQRVAFWGATKIFDALIRFGKLNPRSVDCLVDDYLADILPSVYGVPLKKSEYIKIFQPQVVIVLARNSADDIVKKAKSLGVKNIITFSQMFGHF